MPIVIVSEPDAELVTVPAPEREPIVSEKPLRSNEPVRATADEFEIASDAPNLTVPADMVVAPVYELPAPFNVNAPDPNLVRLIAPDIAPPILFKRLLELIVNAPSSTEPAI